MLGHYGGVQDASLVDELGFAKGDSDRVAIGFDGVIRDRVGVKTVDVFAQSEGKGDIVSRQLCSVAKGHVGADGQRQ